MDWTKIAPTVVALATTVVGMFTLQIQDFIIANPTVAIVLGAIVTIITNFLPSPVKK